jgi:hypothetical protein
MMGSEAYALAKYFLTKNHIIAGNVHPWATPTTLWPTIMLLAISTITFVMNLITLCTYICGVGAANKTSSFASIVGYVMLAAHMVVWAVAVGLFKMAIGCAMGTHGAGFHTSNPPNRYPLYGWVISDLNNPPIGTYGYLCGLLIIS